MTSTKPINRITLFKIPNVDDQQKLLALYKEIPTKAVKDGKPYILSVTAGLTFEDQRNQGFTVVAVTVFKSKQDMDYYDNECQAHAALKAIAKSVHQGLVMVFFESFAV